MKLVSCILIIAITVFALSTVFAEQGETIMREIPITEISGIRIGQAENAEAGTGCTVFIAEDGMRVWKNNLPVLLGEKELDAESAESLMKAAMLGGMAIAHTGTSLPHGLSYALTYNLGVPHGQAVCFFMTGYLEAADPEDCARALELSGFESVDQFGRIYKDCCQLPDVPEEVLRKTLDACTADLAADPAKCKKAPFTVNKELLRKIAYRSLTV